MNKKYIIATIFSGIVVSAIAVFVFTPLGKMLYRSLDWSSKSSIYIYDNKSKRDEKDNKSDQKINENKDNIHYLEVRQPKELFKGDLIITVNRLIGGPSQNIELKLVEKESGFTKVFKEEKLGDVIHFKGYIITLLSKKSRFIKTELKIKAEKNPNPSNY